MYDNAVMESFFSSVKSELRDRFDSCSEAKMELCDYIEVFYNQRRRYSTLDYVSPAAFERRAARGDIERPAFDDLQFAAVNFKESCSLDKS